LKKRRRILRSCSPAQLQARRWLSPARGKPVARLAPVENSVPRRRIPDLDKGKIWVSPDFDDPLREFEKEFYGE
jgi:hypothetical protein